MTSPSPPSLPIFFRFRSSKRTILWVITLAVCTDMFLYSVIVPIIPFSLHSRLGVPEADIQSYVSLLLATYALGVILFSPMCGYWADRHVSRRGPFLTGLVTLAVANAALCFGNSLLILFAARLLQGAAAAAVWSIGYAMIPETVGDEADTGAAIGLVTAGTGVGVLLGPMAGGWVYDRWGYYAVFEMSFGLLAVDVVFRSLIIERKTAEKIEHDLQMWKERHCGGDVQESMNASDREAHDPFKKRTSRFPMGLLPSTPQFLSALWGVNVLGMMLTALDGVIPLFVHRLFGWGPTEAGLIFLAISIPALFDPLFGHLSDIYGPRRLSMTAFLFAIPSYILLHTIQTDSDAHKALLCVALLMIGLCVCVGITPLTAECSAIVNNYKKVDPDIFGEGGAFAQCFALTNVAYASGTLLGPMWAGYVTEKYGFGMMALSFAGLCLISAIPTYLFCGKDIVSDKAKVQRTIPIRYGTV